MPSCSAAFSSLFPLFHANTYAYRFDKPYYKTKPIGNATTGAIIKIKSSRSHKAIYVHVLRKWKTKRSMLNLWHKQSHWCVGKKDVRLYYDDGIGLCLWIKQIIKVYYCHLIQFLMCGRRFMRVTQISNVICFRWITRLNFMVMKWLSLRWLTFSSYLLLLGKLFY